MNEIFQHLDAEYQRAKNEEDTQMQKDCLQKMRKNLMIRNKGEIVYNQIAISVATYEQIREIDGDMNRKESRKKMTETAELARKELLSQNIYGSDNQYP